MDTFSFLIDGFALAIQPANLIYAAIGVLIGTAVGVLPGIGPALTVALLLPVTFKLDPGGSIIMFAGIYYGGMYGGSTTAILLNTPGESASVVTALEGNRMARTGRGGAALATAAIGSFVAALIATAGLAVLAPYLVKIAVKFGPWDYFGLMLIAFVTVSATFGSSPLRGLTSLAFGLWLGLMGIDQLTGQARLTFGVPELLDGVEVTTLAVGLFAIGEAFFVASRHLYEPEKPIPVKGSIWMTREDWKRSWMPWLRGTVMGFPIGALPAGGAEIPTFLSYTIERKLSRKPEEFGHGAIEGVAGPEAANNASAAGTLVPLLTLGLPTSATAAVMLAGFQQYNIQPGPLLFTQHADLVWGLVASLFIANVMLLVLNLPLVGVVGEASQNSPSVALRRHSRVCIDGHDCGEPLGDGTSAADGFRCRRICDAPLRLSHRSGGCRSYPWPACRQCLASLSADEPWRSDDPAPAPELSHHDRHCPCCLGRSVHVQRSLEVPSGRGLMAQICLTAPGGAHHCGNSN